MKLDQLSSTRNIKQYLKDVLRDRVGTIDLESVLSQTCRDYHLGNLVDYAVSRYGFQDMNVVIQTTSGKYFVKIFSRDKTLKSIQSFIELMLVIAKSKVNYPSLYEGPNGYFYQKTSQGIEVNLCVQQYINGTNFHETKEALSTSDLTEISRQAAFYNQIKYKPKLMDFDTWATLRFPEMYRIKKEALSKKEDTLVKPILQKFLKVPVAKLPRCLVHGDIIRTNIMKDQEGKIWLLDLGVTQCQPRIVELAVMAHDLFLDLKSKETTHTLRQLMLREYQKIIPLVPLEIEFLPILIKATHAMYFISAAFMQRSLKYGNAETTFWYEQSKQALKNVDSI